MSCGQISQDVFLSATLRHFAHIVIINARKHYAKSNLPAARRQRLWPPETGRQVSSGFKELK